jgi:hypothetical protein
LKYFAIAEAEALIPEIEKIYETVVELAAQAEMKAAALRRREGSDDADPAASAIERSQLQFLAQRINETLQKIVELGAIPKGINPALVDFPHRLGGREVYLCWRLGDKRLTHYHDFDEGFAGRKPLPRRKSA